jgi:hypothetical protein
MTSEWVVAKHCRSRQAALSGDFASSEDWNTQKAQIPARNTAGPSWTKNAQAGQIKDE